MLNNFLHSLPQRLFRQAATHAPINTLLMLCTAMILVLAAQPVFAGPVIEVTPTSITGIELCNGGGSETVYSLMENVGDESLFVFVWVTGDDNGFNHMLVNNTSGFYDTLLADETLSLAFQMWGLDLDEGTYDWRVQIESNDPNDPYLDVNLTAHANDTGGQIFGTVFSDANANCEIGSDTGLAGWTIEATSGGGTTTTTSASDGSYYFDLPPGTYTISQVMPQDEDWVHTCPTGAGTYSVTFGGTTCEIETGLDFGNFELICMITRAGDVNISGAITSADMIYLVNYIFKAGPLPLPCLANGDVNCSGSVTSADVIYLKNHIFTGGPPPCDICNNSPVSCWFPPLP